MGNFSVLPLLPEMYENCKMNEDHDMSFFDFFTDHLLNFDGIFDKHENGDEQKPHTPIKNWHNPQISLYQLIIPYSLKKNNILFPETKEPFFETKNLLVSNFISKVFRPPIAT